MANWENLQRDASTRGGLLHWPVEVPESQDIRIDLPGILTDDDHEPYDWTAVTSPLVQAIDPDTEAMVISFFFNGRTDGSFWINTVQAGIDDAAGDKRVFREGRPLQWAAQVTLPNGARIQLIEPSPFMVRHRGLS